jgi:hypothetical protein
MPLVTNTRLVQWNRRGREGEGADREPVERRQPGVGHSGPAICDRVAVHLIGHVLLAHATANSIISQEKPLDGNGHFRFRG